MGLKAYDVNDFDSIYTWQNALWLGSGATQVVFRISDLHQLGELVLPTFRQLPLADPNEENGQPLEGQPRCLEADSGAHELASGRQRRAVPLRCRIARGARRTRRARGACAWQWRGALLLWCSDRLGALNSFL